eukprot:TRINITY_DN2667_c1_g1_i3.p4 TRINITY_DN2667_c1_g1~~TRINITY_DN2667_c1_g1_i3.p4  ORF type:complete len:100 (-),score=10.96 TRINITY_DN2667_c1_g1_i3:168-446(-)
MVGVTTDREVIAVLVLVGRDLKWLNGVCINPNVPGILYGLWQMIESSKSQRKKWRRQDAQSVLDFLVLKLAEAKLQEGDLYQGLEQLFVMIN